MHAAGRCERCRRGLSRKRASVTQEDRRAAGLAASTRTIEQRGRLEKVGDVDQQRSGVHRAHIDLEYVHRDAESLLLALLNAGTPVLVVGRSMAGKTRMTAEVLRSTSAADPSCCPHHPMGCPSLLARARSPGGPWCGWMTLTAISPVKASESSGSIGCARAETLLVRPCAPASTPATSPMATSGPLIPSCSNVLRCSASGLTMPTEREYLAAQVKDVRLREGVARYGLAEYLEVATWQCSDVRMLVQDRIYSGTRSG